MQNMINSSTDKDLNDTLLVRSHKLSSNKYLLIFFQAITDNDVDAKLLKERHPFVTKIKPRMLNGKKTVVLNCRDYHCLFFAPINTENNLHINASSAMTFYDINSRSGTTSIDVKTHLITLLPILNNKLPEMSNGKHFYYKVLPELHKDIVENFHNVLFDSRNEDAVKDLDALIDHINEFLKKIKDIAQDSVPHTLPEEFVRKLLLTPKAPPLPPTLAQANSLKPISLPPTSNPKKEQPKCTDDQGRNDKKSFQLAKIPNEEKKECDVKEEKKKAGLVKQRSTILKSKSPSCKS